MLLTLLLTACTTVTTPEPVLPFAVDQCNESYAIPGPFGTLLPTAVDPHQDVYGAEEPISEAFTVGPDPKHVHLGWPGQDTSISVSFVWSTDRGTRASLVEWGPEGDEPTRTEGISYAYGGVDAKAYRVHELKLCGRLTPATTYRYRVGGGDHWSPWYTFRTPATPGTFDTFTVAISGDSRGAYEDFARIVDAMASHDPDLYLFTGDMLQAANNQDEWYAWWEATGDRFAEAFFVPAHGNHELLASNYFAMFSLPGNEQWFSLDYGPMTLASLNDTVSQFAHVEIDQAAFLRDRLGASTAPWKLVMHHRAMYSACTNHGSYEALRDLWTPVVDDVSVDLVLAGHNHIYERSVPIRAGAEVDPAVGATYVVTGGAGASLYTGWDDLWFNAVANPIEHYVIGEFTRDQAVFTARDIDGNIIDTFTVPVSP